jgi:glycosyltransferase involved in cell wall biosynthesis
MSPITPCGEAAVFVDPYDIRALRQAIHAVCRDDELAAGLRDKGLRQAQRFSLSTYAQQLQEAYAAARESW